MYCGECGTENPDTNRFCKSCGKPLKQRQQPAPAAVPASPLPVSPVPAAPAGTNRTKTWIIAGAIIALVVLAVAAVLLQTGFMTVQVTTPALPISGPVTGPFGSALFPGAPAGKPIHGTITSGPQVAAAQGSIGAAGGTVRVNQPGSAINGLTVTAPAGAYPSGQQVTISSAPVTGHTFGNNFNPATPLISIGAGGVYANDPVLVTIPVAIPEDQFAMAFYYDDAAQKLEGIPTARQDEKSLTIATRHFSNILVTFIRKGSLDSIATADSGFRPGTDDWEFTNDGSVLAPKGHCAGQSAAMLWYYTEQRQTTKDTPPLFNRYDNNGRDPAALQFERDDTLGYRFASVMQKNTDQMKYWNNPGSVISNVSDETTFREFKYSILLTGEPQFVTIYRNGGGHAIVCYEVSGSTLWIADPNYPGKERMIVLNGSTLGPYTSGASSTDIRQNGVRIYPTINYVAKTAFFSWPELAAQYAKVTDGSVGAGSFPAYQLLVIVTNDDGTEETFTLDAGTNTKVQRLDLKGKTVQIWPKSSTPAANGGDIIVYDPDGSVLKTRPTNLNPLVLEEGSNLVAVELQSQNAKSWVGFDWLDLNYQPASPSATAAPATPAPAAQSGQHYTSRVYAIASASGCGQDAALAGLYSSSDPYCIPRDKIATASYGSIICGQPPAGCIDTTLYNHGIQAEHQYYIREETNTANGEPVHHRIKDGSWTEWYVDGSVMDQWTYRDGVKVGN